MHLKHLFASALALSVLLTASAADQTAKPAAKNTTPAAAKPATKPAAKPAPPKPVANPAAKPLMKSNEEILAFLPDVVATFGTRKITKAEFIKEVNAQVPPGALAQIPAAKLKEIVRIMINGLLDRELIFALSEKQGYKPSEQMVRDEMNAMFKKLPKEQSAVIEAQLKMQGKTVQGYINEAAKDPTTQKGVAFTRWVREKVAPGIKVSDADAKKFYDANQAQFRIPESVTASHILIMPQNLNGKDGDKAAAAAADKAAKAKAEKILASLKQGADFAKTAEKESMDPGSAKQGGKLGTFTKGQMVPEFEKAAFSLKPGQLSGLVKTTYGYHIIKVSAKTPARTESFDKVKGDIVNHLKQIKQNSVIKGILDRERKATKASVAKF